MPVNGRSWGFNVSDPIRVVHHRNGDLSPVQANTTRAARVGIPQANSAASPGQHDQSERLTCGNDDRSQPESSYRPGPDGDIRTAALHHLAVDMAGGDSLLLLPGSSRTAAAALRTSPDDLAAELNPHKTELNPHKAVEAASRARTDQKRAFRARRSAGWAAMATTRVPAHDGPAASCARHRDPGPAAYGLPKAGPTGAGR